MNLQKILEDHKRWLAGDGGARADLTRADLRSANLRSADLTHANLTHADLRSADLTGANLRSANLRSADLTHADLTCADLTCADLTCANLRSADLTGADLTGADLTCADLRYCIGNMYEVKSMQCDTWMVSYTATQLNIGCQSHTIKEWFAFDDDTIDQMDKNHALTWWKKWKPLLKEIIQ